VGVFLLVFLSTLPVVSPFFFMQNARLALRTSNLIAILMLFLLGCAFGRSTERPAVMAGIIMVIVGAALVGMAIILGG
jgi:VIT1/CCC1 family predicted Fe2+/Mn2+ transporter